MEFVAQRSDAGWGEAGLFEGFGKVVARMRFKGHDATGHTTVRRFAAQKRQHGLVAAMDTVKIADGQGAGGGQIGVVEAAENLHVVWVLLRDAGQTPLFTNF